MRTPKHGKGKLRIGGTNRGGTGRPRDAFKQLCQELASGEKTIASVREILENPSHTQFVAALRWASENGYGKPDQAVTVEGGEQPIRHEHAVIRWGDVEIPL